ncbi:UNVERIFIED_CONTAM: hypothetical protein Sradi_0493900 [Sesamum radiatum]|uniref:Uncharacterized protein n=1 Tax=Sesamum radiatum TaxID=300843 RepID=A0AAW2W827_SESRA
MLPLRLFPRTVHLEHPNKWYQSAVRCESMKPIKNFRYYSSALPAGSARRCARPGARGLCPASRPASTRCSRWPATQARRLRTRTVKGGRACTRTSCAAPWGCCSRCGTAGPFCHRFF